MELIRTLKEKHQNQRMADIERMAEDTIQLADFDDQIYIAYNGTPLVPMEPTWSSKDIIGELKKLRSNFVNSRIKESGLSRIAAVL